MKHISILLVLTLLAGCLAGCAWFGQPTTVPQTTEQTAHVTSAPATNAPEPSEEAEHLEDFTVQTTDGATFTLSEALKTHELVLINLFATWCPPCRYEFPFLQEAWMQRADRVAVVALSIEPEDSLDVLKTFAGDMGLTFPMGRTEGTELDRFVTVGIPTTILVDRNGCVASVEIGARQSTQDFLDLFDSLAESEPSLRTFTVYAEADGQPLQGVIVNFCTDEFCAPVTTQADGHAVFSGQPQEYHVQVVSAPEGFRLLGEPDFSVDADSSTITLLFTEDGR
ncbi:MAG: redoxin domain-containing protein [Oscillospiraceae bacterium]|nr:redoxin domain-containing protein [Oscillospiraceae bacterium]